MLVSDTEGPVSVTVIDIVSLRDQKVMPANKKTVSPNKPLTTYILIYIYTIYG